jgi:hypothetical protein
VTPAEHADEASRLAVEASAVLRDLRDATDRDEAVLLAGAMATVSQAHARAALVQRSVIAEQRRDALVASFRTLAPKETP